MLYLVRMDVNIPRDIPVDEVNEIKAREKAYSQDLQRDGRWQSIWRGGVPVRRSTGGRRGC